MKDFIHWHKQKSYLEENQNRPPFFHEREIWYCVLGLNIGHEQDGVGTKYLRPIVIVKKLSRRSALIIPLTTKSKKRNYQLSFKFKNIMNFALYSQIRFIDTKRLAYYAGSMDSLHFNQIKKNLRELIL